jgi:protein TonB
MNRALVIFYSIALLFHAVVLFYLKSSAPRPPKIFNETYVDVTLTQPPPEPPKPVVVPQPLRPKIETPPPKPEEKPQPPPPPKPEMTIPEPKPEPTKPEPPPPAPKPVVVPQPQPEPPEEKYVSVTELKYAHRVEAIYPPEAQRRHQQGQVTVKIYINEAGVLDKVEIVKSSGHPLLDAAAVKAVKESQFSAAFEGVIPIGQWAEQTFTFRLE